MFRFLVRRVLGAVVILVLISAVTYFLFFVLPVRPGAALLRQDSADPQNCRADPQEPGPGPADLDAVLALHGRHLRRPRTADRQLPGALLRLFLRQPAAGLGHDRWTSYPTTLSLAVGGAAVFLTIGVGARPDLGLAAGHGPRPDRQLRLAARRSRCRSTSSDRSRSCSSSTKLGWLDPGHDVDWAHDPGVGHRADPAVSGPVGDLLVELQPQTRSLMVEQLSEDHVRAARAKGMSGRYVFLRYALRGAMAPIITIFGMDLGALLGGAIITEVDLRPARPRAARGAGGPTQRPAPADGRHAHRRRRDRLLQHRRGPGVRLHRPPDPARLTPADPQENHPCPP